MSHHDKYTHWYVKNNKELLLLVLLFENTNRLTCPPLPFRWHHPPWLHPTFWRPAARCVEPGGWRPEQHLPHPSDLLQKGGGFWLCPLPLQRHPAGWDALWFQVCSTLSLIHIYLTHTRNLSPPLSAAATPACVPMTLTSGLAGWSQVWIRAFWECVLERDASSLCRRHSDTERTETVSINDLFNRIICFLESNYTPDSDFKSLGIIWHW